MGKRKHRNHPEQRAQAKSEDAPGDRDLHGGGFKSAFSHALSSGWVQNTGIAFLGTFVLLVVAVLTKTQIRAAALTFGLMGTATVWICVSVVMRYAPDDKGLMFKVSMAMLANDVSTWYLRYRTPLGDTMAPMPVALFASVTNTKDIPVSLDSVIVSGQVNGEGWINFRHVNTMAGEVYWMYGGDLTDAGLLDLSGNGLDRQLLKPIAAHGTIRGWIFFDTEQSFLTHDGDTVRYMWKAQDSTGETYTFTTEPSPVNAKVKTPEGVNLAGAVLVFSRAHIDLSSAGIKFKRFNDVIIPVPNKQAP